GRSYVGGLVGYNANSGTITNSYATGTVSGHSGGDFYVGGLVGWNDAGTILTSFYDNETNTASMNDKTSYGKTKTEIATVLKSASSEWETDLSKGRGYGTGGNTDLPFLKNVTKLSNTLFEDGFGTTLNPYKITNWTQLQNINNSNILTQNYYFNLLNNLSSSTSDYTNLASNTANSALGWNSIGKNATRALFQFDGLGNTISDLYINRPNEDLSGLFGHTQSGSNIQNIGLLNVNITGRSFTGGLVGANYFTNITNSYVTGTVIGNDINIGGLTGSNSGTISNSYSTGTISGNNINIGGLTGSNSGTISNSYSTGTISGNNNVGGLVGSNGGTISNSYSTGTISGNNNVGGLVGSNGRTISNSFYDKTKNPNSNVLGTGKTTAELEDINTFKNAGWSITADNSLAKGTPMLKNGSWVIYVAPTPTPNPTPNPTPSDNSQKPKVDEQVQRVIASIEPSTNSNSSSNQSLPNSLNSNIRTLSFNGVDETRVINGGVKMPENIANEEDIIK
ncbi:hypothetical protein OZY38_09435, partial [Aliarcobacter cryaerophilus]|uniref:GLUG motif-containing protein n=1 Tax=Aliarcobacter cryaerophilus TaxID=28198 RepID=UPI003BAEE3CE